SDSSQRLGRCPRCRAGRPLVPAGGAAGRCRGPDDAGRRLSSRTRHRQGPGAGPALADPGGRARQRDGCGIPAPGGGSHHAGRTRRGAQPVGRRRAAMIIGTAGHIDHGKTALVRALTGIDADRLPEEKARGITIDIGFAYRPVDGAETLGFVDVPGHERFVHNMLAGAIGIDFVLLVVAADDVPMPQTREHLQILDRRGLETGIVALTTADLAGPDRLSEVTQAVRTLLAPTS